MTEDDIQIYLLDLLRVNFPDAVVTHIPNEVNRRGRGGVIEAGRKRRLGVLKGFPDILVALPEGRCVFVEMKSPKGRVRPEQRAVIERLRDLGFEAFVVRDHATADELVARLGGRHIPSRLGNAT